MEDKYSINKDIYIVKNFDNIDQINDNLLSKIKFKEFGKFHLRFFHIDLYKKKLMIETDNLILFENVYISHNKKMKIYLNPKKSNFQILQNHLKNMDEYFGSDEVKKNLFGSDYNKYKYDPILKLPVHQIYQDNDGDIKTKKEKYSNFGVKIKSDKDNNVKTWILKDNLVCKSKLENNESKYGGYSLIINDTVDDLKYKYIKKNTPIKLIFYYDFIWATKNKNMGSNKLAYGVNLKVDLLDLDNENPEIYSKTFKQIDLTYTMNVPIINNIELII
ncbi:hypothetical protein QJ854_gp331 [Moumouvirus goulette]|uniref:Uncharacterized protein n=1 Tax=Moumouvirus goulette TaxID=1247379 RepID=M1PN94_9VIRU|nr:hypothetical protein QJ854_gp331 [Moumouvirus goulette]AGF85451.1 hypothetical protein glt_00643 [Moumouvirus goulette]